MTNTRTPRLRLPTDPAGRRRVVVENLRPSVDGGRFPAKRVVGEPVDVTADVFADGHDSLHCRLRYWAEDDNETARSEVVMEPRGNDQWHARFEPVALGRWCFAVVAWIDHYETWRAATRIKLAAGVDIDVEMLTGVQLLDGALPLADAAASKRLRAGSASLRAGRTEILEDDDLAVLMAVLNDREYATEVERSLDVDRPLAQFGAWYELFPRSTADEPGRHGTFADVEARLQYVADMGFDIVYLPPIHPIGTSHRKGANNALRAGPDDVGSPWAIGSGGGGHTAIHPDMGTLGDFRKLVEAAGRHELEIALDIAFQCSPDHPWVTEHPEWFRARPDGSIQYAENPPKRYEDIYPFDFESEQWSELWQALRRVFEFWIDEGVRIFRVDNPHTKSFPFWTWLLSDLRRRHPDTIFLAEAFTRPRVMERLAKIGFNQSYTYFAWRNSAWDLREYFEELTQTEVADYLRPNVWPNTPDILTEYLQHGGQPAFVIRAVLAATLAAAYGIYGPAFELAEHVAREPGSEEYLDSEKYQLRTWDLSRPDSLRPLFTRLNRIRRAHPALQTNRGLRFHHSENDALVCYSKRDPFDRDEVLMVVSVDPFNPQSGWINLDLDGLGVDGSGSFTLRDELGGGTYEWSGSRNYVELQPDAPAHIFVVETPR